MPFSRPTLSQLRQQVASDIASNVPGSDPLLRIANLKITGDAQAGLAHLHYGYIDWIAQNAVPYTAGGEFLEAWGALKNVYRKSATVATGAVTFTGAPNNPTPIPAGTTVVRGDGETYTTNASASIGAGGTVTVAVTDTTPGSNGNCAAGTVLTLGTAITGVQSGGFAAVAFTGGADVELDAAFGARVMAAFQSSPQGGAKGDYLTWALQVAGVTRAWVVPNGFGAGTVTVYFMMDNAEVAQGGFPQGTNGVAAGDSARGVAATGDQLTVANYIFPLQSVTALVYACAPIANPINFTIANLTNASATTKAAISAAISGVMLSNGSPGGVTLPNGSAGGTIDLSDIESAIGAIAGTQGFVITSPTGNITSTAGQLATLGTVTYP